MLFALRAFHAMWCVKLTERRVCACLNQDIVIHIDYCAASFMAGLLSHASGRAVVYNAGVAGVKLLELLVGSRELATAAYVAVPMSVHVIRCQPDVRWLNFQAGRGRSLLLGMLCIAIVVVPPQPIRSVPPGLGHGGEESASCSLGARVRVDVAVHASVRAHPHRTCGSSSGDHDGPRTSLSVVCKSADSCNADSCCSQTPAGITVMRAARMLPVLARVWTRVHDYLHTRLHGEGSTLLDDSVTQAARNTANAITVDPQAMARVNQVLRKTQASNGRGPLKLTTVARLSGLKSDAAKNERHHEQAERILEYLSSALWGCAVGGVQKPLTSTCWCRCACAKVLSHTATQSTMHTGHS